MVGIGEGRERGGMGWTSLRDVVSRNNRFGAIANSRLARSARTLEALFCEERVGSNARIWIERRGWDSNPRVLSDASFQDWCIEPLCHPSRRCAHSAPQETSGPRTPPVKRGGLISV